jgi:hypothetical protein
LNIPSHLGVLRVVIARILCLLSVLLGLKTSFILQLLFFGGLLPLKKNSLGFYFAS